MARRESQNRPAMITDARGKGKSRTAAALTLFGRAAIVTVSRAQRSIIDWGQRDHMVRKKLGRGRKNRCRFCTRDGCPRPAFVDYKDVQGLKKLCTSQGKLFSRKRSGNCAAFQRAVSTAIKRARFMALMPYVGE